MGILSWFSRGNNNVPKKEQPAEAPGMNVVDISVFEFGWVAASGDKVTLAGYCPVSDDFEPCRWEIIPASGSDAPQFRVVF